MPAAFVGAWKKPSKSLEARLSPLLRDKSVLFGSVRASNTINERLSGLSNMAISAPCRKRVVETPNPPAFKVTSLNCPSQMKAKLTRRDSDALADVRANPKRSADQQRTLRRRFLISPSCVESHQLNHMSHHLRETAAAVSTLPIPSRTHGRSK